MQYIVYLLMVLAVCIPVGVYFYYYSRRFLSIFPLEEKSWVRKGIPIVFAAGCALSSVWILGLGAVLVLHLLAAGIIVDLLNLLGKKLLKSEKAKKNWSILYRSGIIPVLLVAVVMGYGYYNMRQVYRTEYTIETKKPIGQELKIVQISDLHMGTVMDEKQLRECCERIEEEQPDILALTGDIFDESTSRREMEAAAEILGQTDTEYGIYYVFGNHDYNNYTKTPYYTQEELRESLEENGIRILEEEAAEVTEDLTVVGRSDNASERGDISKLISRVDRNSFILLLDHKPREFAENAEAGIDLQISGHTHAGQIWPTGQLTEWVGGADLNYGWKQIEDFQAVVSSGIAGWGYPVRTGSHSEYVVIKVETEK